MMIKSYIQVFATMSSLQSVAPIMASALYTSLYNATADLSYPWQASYLFTSAGFVMLGR